MNQNPPPIFEYYDYRKYLKDFYEFKKKSNPNFSFRYIGQKVGIDPGYLVKVFQGQKNLSSKSLEGFVQFLKLKKREADYFELLVQYSKARSNSEIKVLFEKLLSYTELDRKKLDAWQYEFYNNWYHTAVREIIHINEFSGDYKQLAGLTRPAISEVEAKKAVSLLGSLGMVKKNPKGVYQLISKFISTGEDWRSIAIRNFQEQTIEMAKQALNEIPKEERDISTVTVSLSGKGFAEARERIKKFREEILEIANRDENVTCAYHFNLQMFPISNQVKLEESK